MSPGIGWIGRQPEALEAATATQVAPRTVVSFSTAGVAALAEYPRPITIVVGGATPTHAPATAVVAYIDENDDATTETLTLLRPGNAQRRYGAAITYGAIKTLTNVAFSAGTGTGATTSIGLGLIPGVSDLRVMPIETWLEAFPDRDHPGLLDPRVIDDIVRGASARFDGAIGKPNGNYTVPFTIPPPAEAARVTRDFALAEAGKLRPGVFQMDHEALRKDAYRDLEALRKALAGFGEAPPDPAHNTGGTVGAIGEPLETPYPSFFDNLSDYSY